jgi:hypothetical protein
MSPPAVTGLLGPIITLASGWLGEHNLIPSPKLIQNFTDQMSAIRTTKQMLLTGAYDASNALHLPQLPWAAEEHARNELSWIKSREDMFAKVDPVFSNKLAQLGTRGSQSAGRTPWDPYKDRVQGALLTGDSLGAQQAMRDYLATFPKAEQEARIKAVQASVRASQPLSPGGSTSAQSQTAAMRWFVANLPTEEVNRIRALVSTYAKTANRTGYFSLRDH